MSYRVVVWSTGNVGKNALIGVHNRPDLELVGVWVSNPAKVGVAWIKDGDADGWHEFTADQAMKLAAALVEAVRASKLVGGESD